MHALNPLILKLNDAKLIHVAIQKIAFFALQTPRNKNEAFELGGDTEAPVVGFYETDDSP